MRTFPQQRLSYQDKTKDDFKWAKETIDSIVHISTPSIGLTKKLSDYERKLSNYQLYNNILNQRDFERECNPMGLEVGQYEDEIQPYNKTYNKIQVLLGEELKRPFNYKVALVNSNGVRSKMNKRDELLHAYISSQVQQLITEVSNQQIKPELVQQEVDKIMPPKEIAKYMATTYLDSKEILASKLLTYFTKKLALPEIKNDAFKHGLLSGDEIVWVGLEGDSPTVQVINPLGFFYHKSPDVKYIQDALYAGYRTYLSPTEILDKFSQYLSKEDITKIESTYTAGESIPSSSMKYNHDSFSDFTSMPTEGQYHSSNTNHYLVTHVEWKSSRKVGFLEYVNEYGDTTVDLISEDFKIPSHATSSFRTIKYGAKRTYYEWDGKSLYWDWVSEVWQGVKIGHDIYATIGPKEYQYRSVDNPNSVKLGFHGVVYNSTNAPSVSLMDRMKPFQYLYLLIMHKLKKLIAQDQGKVFHFDVTMVDPSTGLEKTLYYLKELNIDFYNPLENAQKPGSMQRSKVNNATDLSNMQHIISYINLLNSIDQQISDVAGITRQREGQASPSEAVTNAQQNLIQSSTVTEIYFYTHNRLWETILESLIQCAQAAWKDKSIIKQYVLDDLSYGTLQMEPDSLTNADFGIFITNSSKEQELFESLKQLAQPLLQNDKAKLSDIINIYKSTSSQELEQNILSAEAAADAQLQAQQQAQSQQLSEQFQVQKQIADDANKLKWDMQTRDLQNNLDEAQIDVYKFQKTLDADSDGTPDFLELEKFKQKLKMDSHKIKQDEEKLALDKKKANKPTSK